MRTLLPQIVELYEIIADTIHTLTTSREPVLWRGAEWTPAAVERGELRGSVDGKAATVTLTACLGTLLTRYLASLPILPTRVNIYEHEPESGDTVQVFGGVVLEVIPGADATQVSVNCLSSSCILDAMLPRMIYSGQCQFVLFDSGCGLAAQAWGVTASVSGDGYLRASPPFAVNHRSTPASWVALSSTKVWASGSTQMVVMAFTCRRVLTVSRPRPTKTAEAREPPLPVKVTALAPEGTLAGMRNEPSSVPLPSAVP